MSRPRNGYGRSAFPGIYNQFPCDPARFQTRGDQFCADCGEMRSVFSRRHPRRAKASAIHRTLLHPEDHNSWNRRSPAAQATRYATRKLQIAAQPSGVSGQQGNTAKGEAAVSAVRPRGPQRRPIRCWHSSIGAFCLEVSIGQLPVRSIQPRVPTVAGKRVCTTMTQIFSCFSSKCSHAWRTRYVGQKNAPLCWGRKRMCIWSTLRITCHCAVHQISEQLRRDSEPVHGHARYNRV